MNVARLKTLLWLGSLALAGALGWYVYDFVARRPTLKLGVSPEDQRAVLESVQPSAAPQEDVVPYDEIRTVFHNMRWNGAEVEPPKGPEQGEKLEKPVTPVADLLSVKLIVFDGEEPDRSWANVAYKDPKLVAAAKKPEDAVLRRGETLARPYENVKVETITPEYVRFTFGDAEREPEELVPLERPSDARTTIVPVGPGGAREPARTSRIVQSENTTPWRPARTVQLDNNVFQIGTDTAAEVERDYSRILTQDVSYRPYRNPKTRKVEGLRITRVAPNSVVARHGITEGEILKSINGHPVTSTSDAIAYVKKVANETDTWIAVFEKNGREFTRTYKSPEK